MLLSTYGHGGRPFEHSALPAGQSTTVLN